MFNYYNSLKLCVNPNLRNLSPRATNENFTTIKNDLHALTYNKNHDEKAMNTADPTLSISIKMAPGPHHRQEPVAPDKTTKNNRTEVENEVTSEETVIGTDAIDIQSVSVESVTTDANASPDLSSQSASLNIASENKQEEPATLSTLNEGELRALLDEAITYKCPKDREGKSNLFKELLQEAEADETEEGRRVVTNSRLPGSNRRRHKRDSVSERLTHGGSLQNLAQPIASEFDSSFAYLSSGSTHTYGGNKRKNKKFTGPSVSARQREGGSLPSNVNASHSLASLVNLDLLFDKKKAFCEERTVYDWASKEKSKSLDKPSYSGSKKEEKDKERKETKKESPNLCEDEFEAREKKGSKGKHGTNEMLESDNPPPEYKSDYMAIDLGDDEVDAISERNVGSLISGIQRPHSLDTEDVEGTEMKIIDPRRPVQFIAQTNVAIAQTPVDVNVEFPIRNHSTKPDKSKVSVNGPDVTGALPFSAYNSTKSVITGTTTNSNTVQGKMVPSLSSMMSASWQPQNITMEGPRHIAQHITMKDAASSGEKKSLDENGNAVHGYKGDQPKKSRRKPPQDTNVITYPAEDVAGHRNDDIDSLINFIENKESKGKRGKTSNPMRVKSSSGTKPRAREKDSKREQLPSKLQKSNSLEEISKTKLEDLTTEKSISSSGASSISSQHGPINVSLRRAKQKSTGDATVDCRGDRRSWGTEEGQSIYCNDTGDDYTTRRNSTKKVNAETEPEPEFLVVTKKKKSKKQRRSSSGSRAQNLSTSGSYLQNSRGFVNEYRTPLSPELRRKSASSMPPSDKSDSSDLDSVHSLPVTSNTSKHNSSKNAASSGGTPQASYADIARMATINMSHSSVLNMSAIVPSMLNRTSWPSVPPKTPSEPDKMPQDYYPSLDELQHSDRKTRQHSFSHSNHVHSISPYFEKPPSPTLAKMKNASERKKAEAQEEAINKNIQVFKYVQDIEKIHQCLAQEQKNLNSSNHSVNSNETSPTNSMPSKLNNTGMGFSQLESDNNNTSCTRDPAINTKSNNARLRKAYGTNNQNAQNQALHEEHLKKMMYSYHDDTVKKFHNTEIVRVQSDNVSSNLTIAVHDKSETLKLKLHNNPKSIQECQNTDSEVVRMTKSERLVKAMREQQSNTKYDSGKAESTQGQTLKQDCHNGNDSKKPKQQNISSCTKDQVHNSVEMQASAKKNTSSRPAVILLDETTSDLTQSNELPPELTFGFEINEQLLLAEDSEDTTASPVFSPVVPPLLDKPAPNFDRPPPLFDKHIRYDKFPPNFHMQPPNAHVNQPTVHPVMVQPLPYIGYPSRFPPPPYLPAPPPTPSGIIEKYHPQPKEDFSMLYVAPEEDVNIQTYNHDKIVSFVGLAWDAVMREGPVTTATGRVQFYSGQ